MQNLNDRDIRQCDIIPPAKLAQYRATVIGTGSIGRQVALQLASIGVPSLQLIDPDVVSVENLACQGFFEDDLARAKVHA
ncbi:MAG: ThiF family adenylyltransferase, partial [Planctomycetaceae bacterium]|nr:ThiF family adenylyltransferase [Planctomycetaceae bacterium]